MPAMASSRFLFFLIYAILLLIMITQAFAQPAFLYHFCINNIGNYTNNSTYHKNLNTLLSSLPSDENGNGYGFYNSSYGQNSDDQVYAIGLCRGDVKAEDCRSCLNNSRYALTQLCPNQKEAIGWYDNCMLRYSNSSMYGVVATMPSFYKRNSQNVSSSGVDGFNQELRKLLESVRSEAAAGGSLRKFAYGNATAPTFQTIFAIAQCTPEISEQACSDCLVGAFGKIPQCCLEKVGGRVVGPSCNFRFEVYRFIEPTSILELPSPPAAPPILSPPPPSTNINTVSGGPKSNTSRTVIIILVPIVVCLVLIISIGIWLRVRKTRKKLTILPAGEDADEIRSAESLQFDFDTIRIATDDFSEANKLGQGGFGSVYKGRLFNGEDIAVKRLSTNSGQGDLEFKNEVLLVARLQHRNLVRLLGFCLEGIERLLIYEFVPNSSLDHIIFDPIKRTQLDWDSRYKIIVGITRGIIYLHEDSRLRIIHRDLKASNILVDAEMNPKISDFGMAKLFVLDQTQGNTSRIVGTYGYMAPEYAMHGHFSVKSDVYSFGVLVLEIVSGQKNNSFHRGENVEDLLSYAWKSWREGTASNIIDPTLRTGSRAEIMRCIHIGLLCVQENIADRPTMASIVLMLNSYSVTLPVPSQPAFFRHSSVGSDMSSSGWTNNSGWTAGSDRSKSNSVVKAPEDEVSMITEVYPR
ncbi:PREDICTED: cysteine-rich receptor-like protein kinase 25 isoform X1 [Prunus mume]|uniref:Cysteine-rich receptor-like protein kinase 25 isoform X1 n=1 Tax=Prunus mume TaxID=102107 RepID=A0ABM1LMA8_PRUMU|nr:PREDICTED: cysteine-rich receptor-like protein kinase 25 isoform X1 [Prunus mume]